MESSASTTGDDWIDSVAALDDHLVVVDGEVGPKNGDVPCRSGLRLREGQGLPTRRADDASTWYTADGTEVGSPVGSVDGAPDGSDVGIVGSDVGSPVGIESSQVIAHESKVPKTSSHSSSLEKMGYRYALPACPAASRAPMIM